MKSGQTILAVEDEADLRDLILFNLQREGYHCEGAADGKMALQAVKKTLPDLIILDRMLPNLSGDEVIQAIRKNPSTSAIPIILLTAKAEESDELVGFALGADDYITKPFSMKSLIARVKALLHRSALSIEQSSATIKQQGPIHLDGDRHEVKVEDQLISLTHTEFRLLHQLMDSQGRLLSRDQLINAAIGEDSIVVDRTIDVHIASLRKKLGEASHWIYTVRGVGYTFRDPDEMKDNVKS